MTRAANAPRGPQFRRTNVATVESHPGAPWPGTWRKAACVMRTTQTYFNDLNRLLAAMPPGMLDMQRIEANERRHRHRFYDPPETVYQWLLDQQRRAQAT